MKNSTFNLINIIVVIGLSFSSNAQNLLETLEKKFPDSSQPTLGTFKASRISIGHAVETRKKGVLEFQSMTRFWKVPNFDSKTRSQSLIADKINTRFGLEYGVSDRLTLGAGGTTLFGVFDGFVKYKLLQQRDDKMPLTLTLLQGASLRTMGGTAKDINFTDEFSDRVAITSQILIARKFSRQFSFQVAPTLVVRGSNRFEANPNSHFAIGFGGRYNVGRHVSVVSEYYYQANPLESKKTYDALSIGVNWELSDVMLQFQMTNIRGVAEDVFITQTPNNFNFNDGNFVFGFTGIFILHTQNRLKRK